MIQNTLPCQGNDKIFVPAKIGPYHIESFYAKGGMSILYLGSHPEIARPIMIKVLSPKYVKNKKMAERFLNEAKIIALSKHPNIVRLYGQGNWEKGLYIAMEYIRGVSLRQFITHRSFSKKRALEIILQVAYALSHLHSHGIIHRDLKPENILITESGEIKVIDFGIAQLKNENKEINGFIGTPSYMSPELKNTKAFPSFSSDIYSLGIILYELLQGKISDKLPDLSNLDDPIKDLIEKAINHQQYRYQTVIPFIEDLSKCLSSYQENLGSTEEKKELHIEFPHLKIFTTKYDSSCFTSFEKIPNDQYLASSFKSLQKGFDTHLSASFFQGLIKMQSAALFSSLTFFVENLCRCLDEKDLFSGSFLFVDPNKNLFSFLASEKNILFSLSENGKVQSYPSQNALFKKGNEKFIEISGNFYSSERLLFCSKHPDEKSLLGFLEKEALSPSENLVKGLYELFNIDSVILEKN